MTLSSHFKVDFIGIGAAKSGTTWLSYCLDDHPQICMSLEKELNYFCSEHMWPKIRTNYHENLAWYQKQFDHCGCGHLRGEYSPSYLVNQPCPDLISKVFPSAKLIVAYRNPVDALYSLYFQFSKFYISVPETFENFLDQFPNFINYGNYYTHTMRFLEYFPRENLHSILFEDIHSKPEKVLQELYGFLGVTETHIPNKLMERINERKMPRSIWIRNLFGVGREILNSRESLLGLRKLVRNLKLASLSDWIQEKNLKSTEFPKINSHTKELLQNKFVDENAALEQLISRDLSHWSINH